MEDLNSVAKMHAREKCPPPYTMYLDLDDLKYLYEVSVSSEKFLKNLRNMGATTSQEGINYIKQVTK